MKISSVRSGTIVAASAIIGLSIGGGLIAFADESPAPDTTKTLMTDGRDANKVTGKPWPKNEYGLTVGQPTPADIEAQNLPDLKPYVTDGGEEGFLLTKDFYFPLAKTPEEAAAQTKALVNDKGEIIVKVYRADGETLIGTKVAGITTSK